MSSVRLIEGLAILVFIALVNGRASALLEGDTVSQRTSSPNAITDYPIAQAGSDSVESNETLLAQVLEVSSSSNDSEDDANIILAAYDLKIIYLTIGTFGFLSNMFVVLVIAVYTPMRKHITNIYIVNQSLIDTTVAFFLFFTTFFQDDGHKRTPGNAADEAVCRLWFTKMPLWGMMVSSTYGIVALTLERFLAVVHPLWHKTTFSRRKVMLTMAAVWFIGPAYNIAYMTPSAEITPTGQCTVYSEWPNEPTRKFVGVFTIVVQFVIPLVLLIYGYSRMAIVLHRLIVQSTNIQVADFEAKRHEHMVRARCNVVKTLATVAFFFVFCWSWNQVYYLMYFLGYPHSDFTSDFYNFTVIMVFLNCCVNPIIYCIRYEQFQRGIQHLVCRRRMSEARMEPTPPDTLTTDERHHVNRSTATSTRSLNLLELKEVTTVAGAVARPKTKL